MSEPHCKKLVANNDGFSLIEVLIASAVFAIGFLALASMLLTSSFGSRNAADVTQASAIASNRMEQLMILPFDHSDLDPDANPHQETQGKYDIQWVVADADLSGDGVNDAKSVELSVTWSRLLSKDTDMRNVNLSFVRHNLE